MVRSAQRSRGKIIYLMYNTQHCSVSLAIYYHIKNRDEVSEDIAILDEKLHPLTVGLTLTYTYVF